MTPLTLEPLGGVRSPGKNKDQAPRQGPEVGGEAVIEIESQWAASLEGLAPGKYVWVICFFDLAELPQHMVHPRGDQSRPETGMFATRTPDRPNPLSLTLVEVRKRVRNVLTVRGLDAVDGTPVLDIKPFVPGVDQPPPTQRWG